jgi:gamma-glutamyltranspeptidase
MPADVVDPLLVLLRRHEAANAAFDAAAERGNASEAEKDHLFTACGRTMQEIIDRGPHATTAEGAVAALDHVLNDEALWSDPRPGGEVFLRKLIEAARKYIEVDAER